AIGLGYYHLCPDQAVFSFMQAPLSLPWIKRFFRIQPHRQLHRLPPYTSEILWLPLPGHAQLLIQAFKTDAQAALPIFQHIQTFDLFGFQYTLRQALPQVLASQLTAIQTTEALQAVASENHPLFSRLVPSLYQPELDHKAVKLPPEVAVLFPKFQTFARDVSNSLAAGNVALRERGLERILTELKLLPTQLPSFGLRSPMIKRWQPVITHWQRLLELELQAQQQQSQGELLNPFTFGNPLRDRAELFKGRRRFVDEVYRLVLDRNRPTLVLHGPRRCGKSSFLLNLQRLLPSDLIPVYVDLQASGITNSEADFCYGLLRAIVRDCRSQRISLMALPQRKEFYEAPYPLLEDWLEDALPALGRRRLLLTLDEFEKLGTALTEQRLSVGLLDELRSLIQHQERLAFLFSGVQTLAELGPNWSSYFISVVPMEMLYLEPQEAEDLMLDPDPDFDLRYDTGILPEILRLTRCQPYLLQLLGSAMVTQANLAHTQRITFPLLQAAIEMALTQGDPYFTNVWTEFTGTTAAEILAGQAYLQRLASDRPPPDLSHPDTQNAIRRLHRYHVIETVEGNDRIEIPLIEQWVRERSLLTG
ncbi:MAG: AAA family ATPase, partial [Prochlorotrichaceae cyanobacterium]